MRKHFAVILLFLGIFAWFRFAVECINFVENDGSKETSRTILNSKQSNKNDLSESSQEPAQIRRPLHTKTDSFFPSAVFIFVLGNFVNFFLHLFTSKSPYLVNPSLQFLRAPPVSL